MKQTNLLKIILPVLLCCMSIGLPAQNPQDDALLSIQVTIVDTDGQPLPGATVHVSGNAQGVIADHNGNLSLRVEKNARVEFRYLGMKPVVMNVTKPLTGRIVLHDEVSELDQVVITGYQRTTKRRTTGSLATITAKELHDRPMANLDELLQGKLAGVDVKAVSGSPGSSAKVRIRGTNTITGNAEPLWVVDGVPLQRDVPTVGGSNIVRTQDFSDIFANGIAGINPADIESVTVLKDASAAAIYGSRAAGGVIVITTKRGQEGKLRINYGGNLSVVSKPSRSANLMNAQEKLAWEQELWDEFSAKKQLAGERYPVVGAVGMIRSGYGKYAGLTEAQQNEAIAALGQHTTDWFSELFHNSVSHSHFLSLSGGTQTTAYYFSLGYAKNNGLMKRTEYDRYNVSAKFDLKPSPRVKFDFTADMSMQRSKSPSLSVDAFRYAYFANPYERVYNADGSYAADETYHALPFINGAVDEKLPANGFNVIREINETSNEGKNLSASLLARLNINLLDNLSLEGLASYGYVTDVSDQVNGQHTFAAWRDRPFDDAMTSERTYGSILQRSAYNTNYTLRGQLHYSNTFADKHYLSALLGSEIRGQYMKSIYEKRYGYDPVSGNSAIPVYPESKKLEYSNMLSYASIVDLLSGQSIVENAFASFYFTVDYVYNQRYVVSLTARTDGSNNFGRDEQFNPTGSLGLSWNVDQEAFMQKLKPVLSSLSLRTAFGYTGNINQTVYPQLVMDYLTDFRRTDTEMYRMGYIKNAPNRHLRWEKTRDMKFSVEAGLFNDRLRLLTEVYDRRTRDAVTSVRIPYTTGFTSQSYNTSELLNQGIEFTLSGTIVKTKDWRLSASANIAYNLNKLLKYDFANLSLFDANYEGYPLSSIISGKVRGIDRKLGIYVYETRPGTVLTTPADRGRSEYYAFYLGTSSAPTNGGYSVSASYKKLSLSVGGSYSLGGIVLNSIKAPVSYNLLHRGRPVEQIPTPQNDLYVHHLNGKKDVIYRWTPENPRTDGYPRIIDAYGDHLGLYNYMITSENITRASMLEKISYFKLNSLTLAYNFDHGLWMKKAGISSLGLSFNMTNLFTITDYKGIDPETPGTVYPAPRTFSFGMSVGF